MRIGKVIRARLSPADCMSVVDMLELAGLNPGRFGISAAASIVFSMMLEDMREKGRIPRRLGYEYGSMMNKLLSTDKGTMKERIAVTNEQYANTLAGNVPSLSGVVYKEMPTPSEKPIGEWTDEEIREYLKAQEASVGIDRP